MSYVDGSSQNLAAHAPDAALRRYIDGLIASGPQRTETSGGTLQTVISFVGLSRTRDRLRLPDALGTPDYPLFARVLSEAKRTVGAWGGKPYVVYIPSYCVIVGRNCDPALAAIRTSVEEVVRAQDMPLIDLLPTLRHNDDPRALFTQCDGSHFWAKGKPHRRRNGDGATCTRRRLNPCRGSP